jgi:stress response protein SCP2
MFTIKNFKDVSKEDGTHENVLIYLNEVDEDGEELVIECDYFIETTFGELENGFRDVEDKVIDVYNFKIIDVYNNEIITSIEIENELIKEIEQFLD